MINAQFIFITILFVLFVVGTFYFKTPKTSILLFIIYIYFVSFSDRVNNAEDKILNDNPVNLENKILTSDKNSKSNDIIVKPVKPSIEPRPLTFDLENKKLRNNRKQVDKLAEPKQKNDKINVEEKSTNISSSELVLKDIKICKNIIKRTPVGADNIFTNNVDSLYCYSRIKNPGEKKEIKHAWYYENRLMTQVRYNIKKSNTYRSWTKKTILSSQIGNWRVDIHDNNGTIIGSKKFKIVQVEN